MLKIKALSFVLILLCTNFGAAAYQGVLDNRPKTSGIIKAAAGTKTLKKKLPPPLSHITAGPSEKRSGFKNLDGKEVSPGVLDKSIPQWMEQAQISGLSVAVVRNSKIVYSGAFGVKNTDTKSPVDADTIFEAASLSKPVFAYIFFQLVEEGLIKPDIPLYQYLEYADIKDDARYKQITARMVLDHSTGFPNWRRDQPLSITFQPGSKFSYSGEGYVYLQKVVEKVTGKSLAELAVQRVFTPLKMNNSYFAWNDKILTNLAAGYNKEGKTKPKWQPAEAVSAGSLHTTAEDYSKFLIALMNAKGLSKSTINLMTTPQIAVPGYDKDMAWGLGFGLQTNKPENTFWHWGSNDGYKSYLTDSIKRKTALVYFTNSDYGLNVAEKLASYIIGENQPAFLWLSSEYKYKFL